MDSRMQQQYVLPLDQPIVTLDAAAAFNGLTDLEKEYVHYLARASWVGGLITYVQTSVESGPLFVVLHQLFRHQESKEFREVAIKENFTETEVRAFYIYVCGILCNAGNYKGFGDTKFIPGLPKERLDALLKLSPIYEKEIAPIWEQIRDVTYDLTDGRKCLGYPPNGCSAYFTNNFTVDDNERVQNWCKRHCIEMYNTRTFKFEASGTAKTVQYDTRMAGAAGSVVLEESETVGDVTYVYRLLKGDYRVLMSMTAGYLRKASTVAANENQRAMLDCYAQSFDECSLDMHKDGSRAWIKDKSPAVETYIGFIETYRDPAGVRGEFEGFVAVVNREMSSKFGRLVDDAQRFLALLPWPTTYEKDAFFKPDFTSLDVVCFAGSGIPAGINIPNYDEIRQTEGFKNVSLGNVIPASYKSSQTPFLDADDRSLLTKCREYSFELQVGIHELLGHGSGKLFRKDEEGQFNFDPEAIVDPLGTGYGATDCGYYEPGDTYDSRFGPLSSSYEECRAECVGLYLSLEPEIVEKFGHVGEAADDIVYANWLALVWSGITGLEMWEKGRGWLQAHAQARFVISRVLIEASVLTVSQTQIHIEPTDAGSEAVNKQDLRIRLDRGALRTRGRAAIGDFLLKLQVYKSHGDVKSASELYAQYADVEGTKWMEYREIVLANKKPRKMFVQPNVKKSSEGGEISLRVYEPTVDGLIKSWTERYDESELESIYGALMDMWREDRDLYA